MKAIRYFSRPPDVDEEEVIAAYKAASVTVRDDGDLLSFDLEGGNPVLLDTVQVDKLRQQCHEWLHRRALTPDKQRRWEEVE